MIIVQFRDKQLEINIYMNVQLGYSIDYHFSTFGQIKLLVSCIFYLFHLDKLENSE